MTKNSDFKKRVRALAERDGIPYSEARRRTAEGETCGMQPSCLPKRCDDTTDHGPHHWRDEAVWCECQGTDERFGAVRGGADPMARLDPRITPLQERVPEMTHPFIQPTRTETTDSGERTPMDVILGPGKGRTVDFETLIRLELRRKPAVLILDHPDGRPRLAVPYPADPRGFRVLPTDHADWVCSTCGGYGTGEPATHDPDHAVARIGTKPLIEVEEAHEVMPISGEAREYLHELLRLGRIQPERDDQHHPTTSRNDPGAGARHTGCGDAAAPRRVWLRNCDYVDHPRRSGRTARHLARRAGQGRQVRAAHRVLPDH